MRRYQQLARQRRQLADRLRARRRPPRARRRRWCGVGARLAEKYHRLAIEDSSLQGGAAGVAAGARTPGRRDGLLECPPSAPDPERAPSAMSSGLIRIRGARQHNLKNLDLDIRTGELTVVTGPERVGQVEPGVRHAVRRRPAALRRDLLGLRAPVPRPHGPARGRPRRGRAAGDRHRPDQPGAQLALDGRHDDRAQRPPEAAVRPRRAAVRPQDRAAGAPRHADTIYADLVRRARGAGDPRVARHVPGRAAGQHDGREK